MSLKIDQAFIDTVLSGGLAIDIVHENGIWSYWNGAAYENKEGAYTPNSAREFIEIRNFPAETSALTLAGCDENIGLFQCIVKYPDDVGAISIKQKAEAFLDLFTIGTAIVYDGQKVYPVTKTRDGGRTESGFYQIVCRVNYRAFLSR